MARFQIVLKDRTTEVVEGADAYQQEGPMTTFFRLGDGRAVVDVWATRVASFRTADLVMVRRHDGHAVAAVTADAADAGLRLCQPAGS